MRVLTAVLERVGVREREIEMPVSTPPEVPPMSPKDELRLLENESLRRGMSNEEYIQVRNIGNCQDQVQARIKRHHEFLATH